MWKEKIKLNEKSGEKHAVIYVAISKKKDIRFFCTWWSCPSSRWDWTSVGSWCCGWAAQVEKNKDLWKNSQLCLLTWSGRKKETGFSFYYFFKDLALGKKNSGFTYLIRRERNRIRFYYFYKDLWKKFWTLLTWSGRKKTGFSIITFIRICEKIQNFTWSGRERPDSVFITFIRICAKNSELYFLDPEEKKPDSVSITFIRICERKKIQTLLTWSRRKKPDSVFITFIRICEKNSGLYLLDLGERDRIQFLLLL